MDVRSGCRELIAKPRSKRKPFASRSSKRLRQGRQGLRIGWVLFGVFHSKRGGATPRNTRKMSRVEKFVFFFSRWISRQPDIITSFASCERPAKVSRPCSVTVPTWPRSGSGHIRSCKKRPCATDLASRQESGKSRTCTSKRKCQVHCSRFLLGCGRGVAGGLNSSHLYHRLWPSKGSLWN